MTSISRADKALVRQELARDVEAIAEVHGQAFGQEYEGRIVERLRSLPEYIPELSLVAELEGQVVGHVILSRLAIEGSDKLLALGPIGVLPEHQRKGIGSRLMQHAVDAARALGYAGIVLIGHPTYYPRFGFVPASRYGIRVPYEVPDDVAMVRPLYEGALDGISGPVRYSDAFEPEAS